MVHTSPDKEGQVYSPEVNYTLMVICVAVVLAFQDATSLGNAFGTFLRLRGSMLQLLYSEDSWVFSGFKAFSSLLGSRESFLTIGKLCVCRSGGVRRDVHNHLFYKLGDDSSVETSIPTGPVVLACVRIY